MQTLATNFSAVDWVIVAVYLLGTVAIGVIVNRYIHSIDDYIVAGRSLRSFASVATLVGSELGLVTVMYMAESGFRNGMAAFHIGVIAGVSTLVIGLTGFIVVPLREMGVMTIPEFYARRFGRGVQVLGGLMLSLGGVLNMGLFLKIGAVFVAALTGLTGPEQHVYVNWIMAAMLAVVLIYTVLGGMVSVVITDYLQFVVLAFGMLVACGWPLHSWAGGRSSTPCTRCTARPGSIRSTRRALAQAISYG